jgi:hypothetical protein
MLIGIDEDVAEDGGKTQCHSSAWTGEVAVRSAMC